jgi:hypothetical protein
MPFYGNLKYEKIDGEESFAGRPIYRLTESFGYDTKKHMDGYHIVCDAGFETDFASIPEWIFFVNHRDGKWKKASVIHDKACILAKIDELTYKEADLFLYYAMLDDQASKFSANFFYFWCRAKHLLCGQG